MKKNPKLVYLEKLYTEAFMTWLAIFNKEDEVRTCEEAWYMRSLAERAFSRMQRRHDNFKRFQGAIKCH